MRKLLSLLSMAFFIPFSHAQILKYCGADELRISTLQQNPAVAQAVIRRDAELESFTQQFVADFYSGRAPAATYIIPVVFHVIHNYGVENITDAQIRDGLDILNKTFRKQLADTASIVAAFKPLHADCDIEFRLAQRDPSGNCHSGINRIASPLTTVGDHSVKSIIQWPTNNYLNVYIVQNAAGLAGHCVWPADADSIPAWDGIVIAHNYVGTIGTSNYTQSVAFAHECGHYLNLQHIWGGNNVPGFYYYPCADTAKDCNIDDLVADTPPTIGWQSCNLSGASCLNAVDNVQNTMDYSYCNRMFTYGQKARMQACLNSPIAGRNNLWTSANLIATGTDTLTAPLCAADFTANKRVVCQGAGSSIIYTNTSYNGPVTSLQWTFPGGSPAASTVANPTVTYATAGKYDVSLKVLNGTDSVMVTKSNYISVLPSSGSPYPFSESFETVTDLDGTEWFSHSFDTVNNFQLTDTAAFTGSKCVMLDNYNATQATKDELYSDIINLSGATALNLSFKYAYAQRDSAGNDKLQLYMSNNCNTTWIPRITITGTTLNTAPLSATPFTPAITEWKQAVVTVPATYMTSSFRFKFLFTGSGGNNLYIDDINLSTTAGEDELPLTADDMIIFPNPARDHFTASLTLRSTTRLEVSIVDVMGQLITHSGMEERPAGDQGYTFSTEGFAPGVYFFKVESGNSVIARPFVILPH